MKSLFNYIFVLSLLVFSNSEAMAQDEPVGKTRFLFGVGVPEFLHLGLSHKISPINQFGASLGVLPVWGGQAVVSVSAEHRLYFGPLSKVTNYKSFYFRQGLSYFPQGNTDPGSTLNLTIGKDFNFWTERNGLSLDLGIVYVGLDRNPGSSYKLYDNNIGLGIRIQLYFY
jgi:hypothetical protein